MRSLLGVSKQQADQTLLVKYIPRWMNDFAPFRRYAKVAKPVVLASVNKPFEETKRHMVRGTTSNQRASLNIIEQKQGTIGGSFAAMLIQDAKGDAETEDCIKFASTGIFLGQMDTVSSIHPQVLRS